MANLDNSEIMQLAGEGRADDLLELLFNKCMEPNGGLYYFTKVVLGYKELVPHYHLPFANKIQGSIGTRRGYLRPRGHFKSTIAAKSYPLWRLCGGGRKPNGPDPRNLRFLIVGESDDVAKKDIKDPAWHIEHNQLLRALFPQIIPPDFSKVVWKQDEIEIARPSSFDEPSLKSVGVGAKCTGFHFDGILYDDIIGEKAAKSEAIMKEAMEWFIYASGLANDPATIEELMIGTRWLHGIADLYGYIMQELPKDEEQGTRASGFEWDVEGCYDEEGEVRFWPRFSHEILAGILKRQKTYKFSCQYLNNPTAPEGSKFTEEQIKTFSIGLDEYGKRNKIIPSDGTAPIKLTQLSRLSFYDPSSGGKSAKSENAIACVGCAPDGRKFALKVWSANCGFRGAVEMWMRLNDQFITWPNFFEGVGAHKEVGSIVVLRQQEGSCKVCEKDGKKNVKHRRLSPQIITPPGGESSKADRILTFAQADIEDGLLYLHDQDFLTRRQILEFPLGDLLDRFDALAYGIHYSIKPVGEDEADARSRDEQRKRDMKVQRTNQEHVVGGYI